MEAHPQFEDILCIEDVSPHATSKIIEEAKDIQLPPSPPQYFAPQAAARSNRGRKAKNHKDMEKINAHFPPAVDMRQVFRKFKDAMLSETPSLWKDELKWRLGANEFKLLQEFLADKECVYAYKALQNGYQKRPNAAKENKKESLLSKLCYKINQSTVDEFMKRKELNFAFFCALNETINFLVADNAKPEAILAARSLGSISLMYAEQLRFV
ncbi:hypothetical protein FGO68_gene16184 [Halteria grandinella]|uniref:Uncharacterized protein n=1 Tax=Halteria grandinella TaxID=5974 RepID=A0A8J8T143_HALGN|nr:hypothetical protein FGO68_gene16184 [Halteria grandinella]